MAIQRSAAYNDLTFTAPTCGNITFRCEVRDFSNPRRLKRLESPQFVACNPNIRSFVPDNGLYRRVSPRWKA
jgi:hypothetical protein